MSGKTHKQIKFGGNTVSQTVTSMILPIFVIVHVLTFDRVRKEEIQALAGPNEYQEFRMRIQAIDKFYSKHQNEVTIQLYIHVHIYTRDVIMV